MQVVGSVKRNRQAYTGSSSGSRKAKTAGAVIERGVVQQQNTHHHHQNTRRRQAVCLFSHSAGNGKSLS